MTAHYSVHLLAENATAPEHRDWVLHSGLDIEPQPERELVVWLITRTIHNHVTWGTVSKLRRWERLDTKQREAI